VRLTVVGCSPAWPNPGGAQSGYLVNGTRSALLDCGPGVLARLRERDGWPAPDAIVITHFHLDHWGDLVPWVWGASYLTKRQEPPRRPELWVPPRGGGVLEQFGSLLGHADMFARTFALHEYAPGEPFPAAGFEFTALRVPHYEVEAYALRASDGSRTLAYSGDSAPSSALVAIARDADLFLCEATLAAGDLDGEPRGHLSADEALEAHEHAGAKRLLLTHRPEELPVGAGIELAHDGMVCEL
jgi:ribonuclease BN (tRNA processing enzyme)